jgi:hypothetical protein
VHDGFGLSVALAKTPPVTDPENLVTDFTQATCFSIANKYALDTQGLLSFNVGDALVSLSGGAKFSV